MRRKMWSLLVMLGLAAGVGVAILSVQSCGDDEECLSEGENCSQQYLQDTYGRTDIYCCEGQCSDGGGTSPYLTCRS